MVTAGEIARVRKDRYVVPRDVDLFTGIIQFHPSGAAHVLSEKRGEPDLYVSAENTWTAMHGDRVVARLVKERPLPADSWRRPTPTPRREGRVIRILTRANETLVGTLHKSKKFFYVAGTTRASSTNLYVPEPPFAMGARVGDKVVAKLEDGRRAM